MSKQTIKQDKARRRAQVIMKVRCGLMTGTEAAKLLGVSRKTYYKWEQRGLTALMQGVEDQSPGRPETPQIKKREADLKKRLLDLERERELLLKQMALKDLIHQMDVDPDKSRTKKK